MTINKRERILLFAGAVLMPPLAAIISPVPALLVILSQIGLGVLVLTLVNIVQDQ